MYLLIQANDVKEAYDNTVGVMKDTMGEYTIPAIAESPIMDVFPYFSGEEGDVERLEKFNTIKASVPEVAAQNDDLELADVLAAENKTSFEPNAGEE